MENHNSTDWVEKHFVPLTCFKGHTCKDCPESKGCFFGQKEKRGKLMYKCIRCNKPATVTVMVDKPVYETRLESFYKLCGHCLEELEEFLRKKGDKTDGVKFTERK